MNENFRLGFAKSAESAMGRYVAARLTGGGKTPRELAEMVRKNKGLKAFLGVKNRGLQEAERYESEMKRMRSKDLGIDLGKEVHSEAGFGLNFSWTPDTGSLSVMPALSLDPSRLPIPKLDGTSATSVMPALAIGDKIRWLSDLISKGTR